MIDTNTINQAGDVIQAAHAQWQINGPALAFGAALVARELRNFNQWVKGILEWIIGHGGIGWLLCKLIWNPPAHLPGGASVLASRANPTQPIETANKEKQ